MVVSGKREALNRIYFGTGAMRKTVGLSQEVITSIKERA